VGIPIEDSKKFIYQRLHPALDRWLLGASGQQAKFFHLAVLGCRWLLVPSASWAMAYGDALGGTGRVLNVTVEATWVRFADAFRGEVADFWRAATQDTNRLYLLLFSDLDRALPQCWAKPWLDALAGFRDTLPNEQVGWPSNLRVLGTLATDTAVLPLDRNVVNYWGAIRRDSLDAEKAESALDGHVPLASWLCWARSPDFAKTAAAQENWHDKTEIDAFGALRRSVWDDLKRLTAIGQCLGEEAEVAALQAEKIRIEWPREYCAQESEVIPASGRDNRPRLDRAKK